MKNGYIVRSRCSMFLLLLIFSQISCALPSLDLFTHGLPVTDTVTPTLIGDPATGWLQVYFTDPTASHAANYEAGPDVSLAAAIDQARLSVDVAIYSINLWSIQNALIHAHKRGVLVRMVMESDNMDDQVVQKILDAGIPIIGDQHEGLMHDKFIVIDRSEVWTGSMNYTTSGTYKDNNNLIRIRSNKIANDYTNEFEVMFSQKLFGPDKPANRPNSDVTIDGTQVEIFFSPEDNAARRIVELLQEARESIHFMVYTFTSNDIGDALVKRAQAGITVDGVMDEDQAIHSQGSEYDPFMQAGLDVRLDGNQAGLMHHKVIVIDRKIVIAGSYNLTASAEKYNDENVVIIYSPRVAELFMEEFQRVYGQAKKP